MWTMLANTEKKNPGIQDQMLKETTLNFLHETKEYVWNMITSLVDLQERLLATVK